MSPQCSHSASVMTDRHGFVIKKGSTVVKIEDDTTFVVVDVMTFDAKPVIHLLYDANGGSVDASLVMLTDEEKVDRALFCECCFNHYQF